jgi:hypothetical protein
MTAEFPKGDRNYEIAARIQSGTLSLDTYDKACNTITN